MRQYAKVVNFAELYIELLRVNLRISGKLNTEPHLEMFSGVKRDSRDMVGIDPHGFAVF